MLGILSCLQSEQTKITIPHFKNGISSENKHLRFTSWPWCISTLFCLSLVLVLLQMHIERPSLQNSKRKHKDNQSTSVWVILIVCIFLIKEEFLVLIFRFFQKSFGICVAILGQSLNPFLKFEFFIRQSAQLRAFVGGFHSFV